MPTLNKIAEWWADQDTDPTYGDRLSVIGLGEPFCFRCGWLAPVDDTITAIARAYGFGSQTAFPQMKTAGQGEAEMVSVRR